MATFDWEPFEVGYKTALLNETYVMGAIRKGNRWKATMATFSEYRHVGEDSYATHEEAQAACEEWFKSTVGEVK